MINYLFSGIDKEKGFTKEQSSFLKEDILPNSIITFVASVFDSYEKNDLQISNYIKFFQDIGITFKEANLIDSRVTKEEAKQILEKTDIIFLLGGSPELQMKWIREYELIDYIKKSRFNLGVSAGAMNQSNRVMYKDDFDDFKMKDYAGLGVVNINIFPHIELENQDLLEEAKEISKEIPLILLPNDSFVRIKDGNIEILGRSYKLYKENFVQ